MSDPTRALLPGLQEAPIEVQEVQPDYELMKNIVLANFYKILSIMIDWTIFTCSGQGVNTLVNLIATMRDLGFFAEQG